MQTTEIPVEVFHFLAVEYAGNQLSKSTKNLNEIEKLDYLLAEYKKAYDCFKKHIPRAGNVSGNLLNQIQNR